MAVTSPLECGRVFRSIRFTITNTYVNHGWRVVKLLGIDHMLDGIT